MPESGRLTAKEREAAIAFIAKNWTNAVCPFHGPTTWDFDDVVAEARPFHGGNLVLGGGVFPLLVLTCGTCGFTVFVNAVKAGVVVPEAPPTPPVGEPAKPPSGETG